MSKKFLFKWKKYDFPQVRAVNQANMNHNSKSVITSIRNNDFRMDRRVRMNFYRGKKNGVLPYGLKKNKDSDGNFLQRTGTCGDCSDHIRMVKLFGRAQFNNLA